MTSDFLEGFLMVTGAGFWMALFALGIAVLLNEEIGREIGHHPDTLRIRCEDEQGGVLIGQVCIKKEAILWSEKDAPR